MNPDSIPAIGIDFGGTSIKLGVVLGDKVLALAPSIATQEYSDPQEMIDAIAQFAKQLLAEHPEVKVVGMGIPGFVNFYEGTIEALTNVPGWHNVAVRQMLEEKLGLPVVIDNDANCMAYAEWKLGAGKGMKNIVCFTLGTGVGSGIIINNELHRGANCAAGEFGQTTIDYKGRLGHWGTKGALEDYIGNKEIAADARTLYAAHGQDKAIVDCSPLALERAALEGDAVAQQVWRDMAQKLASGMINCCYILNPEAFIIGGGIAKAKDLLFEPLGEFMSTQLYPLLYKDLKMLPAQLGTKAGIIGAARLAIDTLLCPEKN